MYDLSSEQSSPRFQGMKTNHDYCFDENYADISLRVKIKTISENHTSLQEVYRYHFSKRTFSIQKIENLKKT